MLESRRLAAPNRVPYAFEPMLRRLVVATVALAAITAGAACAKSGPDLVAHGTPDSSVGFSPDGGLPVDDSAPIDLEAGPAYAVLGVQPSHGPFSGGTRIEIRGRGFSSNTLVRLGALDVPAADVVARDPYHVQVVTPPGEVGPVDVQVSDSHTGDRSVLVSGFTYDSYYADPNVGATSGGTHVTLIGRGTKWVAGTKVTIDGKSCADLVVVDQAHLRCTAPAGTPGTKAVTVTTPDAVVDTVRDAYSYADTGDGYRGGLAGDALPGELVVLALAYPTGDLVPGASVYVRGADGTTQLQTTDATGVASFAAPPPAPLTVTIGKKCLSPTTFDGVKVRSVTAYLSPVASVACIPPDGTPPPTGGRGRDGGVINGEIVFGTGIEFRRGVWKGIPDTFKPTQRPVAYVFTAGRDNLARFQLPDGSTGVTPASPGTLGYAFSTVVYPGNVTLYAIAGIEDRPTDAGAAATFDPYVFGIVRGVGVPVGGVVDRVLIPMTGAFNHAVSLHVPVGTDGGAPISPRGPDRLRSTLAIDLGDAYMVLPYGFREDLLPLGGDLGFVGVPPLAGALGAASYIVGVEDVNGGSGGAPLSAVLRFRSRDDSAPIAPGPFVPIPKVTSPAADAPWDGRTVSLELPAKSADLIVVDIASADGATSWTVVAPGDSRTVNLPDFKGKPELGLPGGALTIGATAARIDKFDYQTLRYGQLGRGAWTAYGYDTAFGEW
ncbi:MAG: hypothetical protein NVS3B10_06270 [Polyangiales bacterium]